MNDLSLIKENLAIFFIIYLITIKHIARDLSL